MGEALTYWSNRHRTPSILWRSPPFLWYNFWFSMLITEARHTSLELGKVNILFRVSLLGMG